MRRAAVRILAIEYELPGATPEAFRRLAQAEASRAWQLYQDGVIRELYFRQDRPEAVLLLECGSEEEAAASLNTLPFVEAGLIVFEIILLVPYPGFSRLFANDDAALT
jgi:hypothetical protein